MALVNVPVVVEQRAVARVPPMDAHLLLTQIHSAGQSARHLVNAPRILNVRSVSPTVAPLPKIAVKFVFLLVNVNKMEKIVRVAVLTLVKRVVHVEPAVLEMGTVISRHAQSAEILQHV
jgi:hypothetical protein